MPTTATKSKKTEATEAEKKALKYEQKALPFAMGADPEFHITAGPKKLNTGNVLDDFSVSQGNGPHGQIGIDGSLAEIRPKHSYFPEEVADNIGTLLASLGEKAKILNADTRSNHGAAGGHVHFGIKPDREEAERIHRKLIAFCVPIFLGEDPSNANLRLTGSGYGKANDYRVESRGNGNVTYELRTLSAEWITTKKIATSTLAYLGVVMNEILNNAKKFDEENEDLFFANMKQALAIQSVALSQYSLVTEALFNTTRKRVRTFKLYPLFKKEIDYILRPDKVLKDKRDVNFDALRGWKINGTKVPSLREIGKKRIQESLQKVNADNLKQYLPIAYNDDLNMPSLVEELSNIIMASSWKLKKGYIFYGLRKGLNEPIISNVLNEIVEGKEIKTRYDLAAAQDLCMRLGNRDSVQRFSQNFTMKNSSDANSVFIVGVPYEMRAKKDLKSFVRLVKELENKTLLKIEPESTQATVANPANKKGRVWCILNSVTPFEDVKKEEKEDEKQSANTAGDTVPATTVATSLTA